LYFNLLSASFVCRYCHIYQCACFLFFVFNYFIWPICCNLSVCVYCFIIIIIIIIIIRVNLSSNKYMGQ
jgi:hypothetical protein